MTKNILKKFVVLLSLGFVLFSFNFVNAVDEENIPFSLVSYEVSDTEISPNGDGVRDSVDIDIEYSEEVKSGTAEINIINSDGDKIKSLYVSSSDVANPHNKNWDGTDESNQIVSNGLYTIQILGVALADNTNTLSDTSKIITVNNPIPVTLSNISITTPAVKLDYTIGETLDITGLEVAGTYSDDSTKIEIITIENITGFDSSAPVSDQVLTITVDDKTITYTVNINITSTPIPEEINIHLEIISGTNSLYDNDILVTACDSDNNIETPDTISAYCAIQQLQPEITSDWSWYGDGAFVNSIGSIAGYTSQDDEGNNVYHYWSWSLNGNYGETGLNQYELKVNDLISLNFIDPQLEVVAPDSVNINLKIYAGDTVLFDGQEAVQACAESPATDAPLTINGKCAIEQLQPALSNTWTWNYAPSGWLDELGGYKTTEDYSKFWSWFDDLVLGGTGLNQHILSDNEELLLTYGSYPLRISASTSNAFVSETIIFTAEEESTFDSNYNMIWTKSSGVTITLGVQSCTTIEDGTCSIVLNTTGSLDAIGSKMLYVPSAVIKINVSNNNSNGGGGGNTPTEKTFSVPNALNFIFQNKASAPLFVYDWIAIAGGAGDNSNLKSDLVDYLKSNPINSSIITENERRAMALMALGINPYNGTEVNYIQKITDSFNGIQFDDASDSEINDDIFALIVLQNAGYDESDEMINKTISYVISNQSSSGSWGSVDMTSASIMALKDFEDVPGVSDAISKAENYLIESQNEDGGFDNSASTSWATQALSLNNSFDDKVDDAIKYLADKQQEDGGIDGNGLDNRTWNTSYAVPAVLRLSWNDILEDFEKVEEEESDQSGSKSQNENITQSGGVPEPIIILATQEVVAPLETKDAPVKIVKVEKEIVKKEVEIKPLVQEESNENFVTENNLVDESNLLASAGNTNNFFKDKVIILTIISVLVISIGGWLTNKYI